MTWISLLLSALLLQFVLARGHMFAQPRGERDVGVNDGGSKLRLSSKFQPRPEMQRYSNLMSAYVVAITTLCGLSPLCRTRSLVINSRCRRLILPLNIFLLLSMLFVGCSLAIVSVLLLATDGEPRIQEVITYELSNPPKAKRVIGPTNSKVRMLLLV